MSASRTSGPTISGLLFAVSIIAGLAVMAASFRLSVVGLTAAGRDWLMLSPADAWTVPVFFDGATLVYTGWAFLAKRRAGQVPLFAWASLGVWTLISSLTNGYHAYTVAPDAFGPRLFAVAIAALAPIAVYGSVHGIVSLLVMPRPLPVVEEPAEASLMLQLVPSDDEGADETPRRSIKRRRVTDDQLALVLELHDQGKPYRTISEESGVSTAHIGRLVKAHRPAAPREAAPLSPTLEAAMA